jgi:catechol 2,3-dioxygenase-like lactoylglutathione lyase family enzyme
VTNRLDHAHLFCSDVDATVDFFARMFGGRVVMDEADVAGVRNLRIDIGGGAIHLYDQPPRGQDRPLVHHLGIRTDDLPELVEHMRAEGYIFRNEISDYPGFRYVMVEATDGLLLELYETQAGALW